MMMNKTKKAALKKKTTALRELKRKYLKPGDPLYLAGIQRIRDHYKKRLST